MPKLYQNMSFDSALEKAMRYCSYQERCRLDLENRFVAWNVKKNDFEPLIQRLIKEDFLNERRYIEAYVRGKFLIKKWGKNKIKMGLMAKKIFNEELVAKVFVSEIDENTYVSTIKELISKKNALLDDSDPLKKRDKIYRYLLNKGYESELVVTGLKTIT